MLKPQHCLHVPVLYIILVDRITSIQYIHSTETKHFCEIPSKITTFCLIVIYIPVFLFDLITPIFFSHYVQTIRNNCQVKFILLFHWIFWLLNNLKLGSSVLLLNKAAFSPLNLLCVKISQCNILQFYA